jgi:N-acetylmuramoyl-L-alanine amidase
MVFENAYKAIKLHHAMKKLLVLGLITVAGVFLTSSVKLKMPNAKQPTGHTLKTVVIDAGHGGKDPGAIGKVIGLKEKDLVLDVSLRLGKQIKERFPEVKVLYTRDKDVFINLYDRAKLANNNNADLFISIHANATDGTAAFGTETWVLGLHKTDAQKAVADKENSTIYLEDDGGAQYKDFDMSPDAIIARSLMLGVYLNHSVNFAGLIQKSFKSKGRNDRGVKQGGLIVLFTATVPAVLVELGFLSNPAEEKYMASEDGKKELTQSMFEAFVNYKSQIDGVAYQITKEKPAPNTQNNPPKPNNPTTPNNANPVDPVQNQVVAQDDVIFRVQIISNASKLPANSPRFKGQQNVFEYFQDNLYKYTVGYFVNDYKSANDHKNQMRQEGFETAFVVAFINNERVDLQKAITLASKK